MRPFAAARRLALPANPPGRRNNAATRRNRARRVARGQVAPAPCRGGRPMLSDLALIITGEGVGFPQGFAPTQRVRNYAAMLMSTGFRVQVLCADPNYAGPEACRDQKSEGEFEGVAFRYAGGSAVRSPYFLVRRMRAVLGWLRILAAVVSERPAVILAYPMTPTATVLLVPAARMSGAVLVSDQSELPSVHAGAGIRGKVELFWRWRGLRGCDGVVAISPTILTELTSRLEPSRLLLLPVVIDADEFGGPRGAERRASNEIVYTGRLDDTKDGVGTLLEAFAAVIRAKPDARLALAGEHEAPAIEEYRSRAAGLGVEDFTRFTGRLSREDLIRRMREAAALVLPRPDTPQNRANMPTKLIEYLASGSPVVATSVGVVTEVLRDGEHAVLVTPGDRDALSDAIVRVLSHPAESAEMGARGRELAARNWDYRQHAPGLAAFLQELARRRAGGGSRATRTQTAREGDSR